MPKFKNNDLITDGKNILWITSIVDDCYLIKYQDESEHLFKVSDIDAAFYLWSKKTIWHKSTDIPEILKDGKSNRIIFQTDCVYFFVGFVSKTSSNVVFVSESSFDSIEPKDVKRWCFLDEAWDILDAS